MVGAIQVHQKHEEYMKEVRRLTRQESRSIKLSSDFTKSDDVSSCTDVETGMLSSSVELTQKRGVAGTDGNDNEAEEEEEEEEDDEDTGEEPSVTNLKLTIRLVALHQSWGFRFIFFSIPYMFYAAGPIALAIASIGIIVFLAYFDSPTTVIWKGYTPKRYLYQPLAQ